MVAKIIPLDPVVARTMNELRLSIPFMKGMNTDGTYDVAIRKDKAMLSSLLNSVIERAA